MKRTSKLCILTCHRLLGQEKLSKASVVRDVSLFVIFPRFGISRFGISYLPTFTDFLPDSSYSVLLTSYSAISLFHLLVGHSR